MHQCMIQILSYKVPVDTLTNSSVIIITMATKTSIEEHFKIIRSELKEIKVEAWANTSAIKSLERTVKSMSVDMEDLRGEIKQIKDEFSTFDQKLFDWKSEIHNLIDEGFTSKAKRLENPGN